MAKLKIEKLSKWKGVYKYEINIQIRILDTVEYLTLRFPLKKQDEYLKHWKYLKSIK